MAPRKIRMEDIYSAMEKLVDIERIGGRKKD
jgi:hypothetical protein